MAGGFLVEHASLDDLLINVQLVLGCSQDLLLHAVHGAEAEHAHLILLPNTVRSVLCLQILKRGARCLQSNLNLTLSQVNI